MKMVHVNDVAVKKLDKPETLTGIYTFNTKLHFQQLC